MFSCRVYGLRIVGLLPSFLYPIRFISFMPLYRTFFVLSHRLLLGSGLNADKSLGASQKYVNPDWKKALFSSDVTQNN